VSPPGATQDATTRGRGHTRATDDNGDATHEGQGMWARRRRHGDTPAAGGGLESMREDRGGSRRAQKRRAPSWAKGTGGAHRVPWRAHKESRGLHRRRPRQQGARRAEPRRRVSAPPAAPCRRPRPRILDAPGETPHPAGMRPLGGVQRRRAATPPTSDVPRQEFVRPNAWCCHTAMIADNAPT